MPVCGWPAIRSAGPRDARRTPMGAASGGGQTSGRDIFQEGPSRYSIRRRQPRTLAVPAVESCCYLFSLSGHLIVAD